MEKPENLISREKMIDILNDLALVNAAKTTNPAILIENGIDPTTYIFTKYAIDSLQFVESDRYYASIPEEHEKIYRAVEARLETEKNRIEKLRKIKDSIKAIEMKAANKKAKIVKDSLLKNDGKKK